MAHDVFISYSSVDKAIADALCEHLEAGGIRCWLAPRDILPGTEYGESIVEGIAACTIMVIVFSRSSSRSPQVHREVERAMSKDKVLLPFRIEEVQPEKAMEYYLGNTHWLNAFPPPLDPHLQRLRQAVERQLGDRGEKAPDGIAGSLYATPEAYPPLPATLPAGASTSDDGTASSAWPPLAPGDTRVQHASPDASSGVATARSFQDWLAGDESLPWGSAVRMGLMGAAATMKVTGWRRLGPPHLWLGLTYLPDGVLCQALRRQGLDPTTTRRALREQLRHAGGSAEQAEEAFTETSQQALRLADQLARRAGEGQLREQHLLAGVLLVADPLLTQLLRESAIDGPQLLAACQTPMPPLSEEPPVPDQDGTVSAKPAADPQAPQFALNLFADDGELELAAFAPDCQSALGAASGVAGEMGHEEIRSAHLFLGILARPGSQLQPLVVRSGVRVSTLREAFRRSLSGGLVALGPCRLHRDYLSKNALSAIRKAVARAQQRGGHTMTELDLLTVLLQRESRVTRVLEEHHMEPAQLLTAFSSHND